MEERHTLIGAPTGAGRTLAGFLAAIDAFYRAHGEGSSIEGATQVVYVSPLKALAVDVHANLEQPLAEIADVARELGHEPAPVTVAVRTGDSSSSERQSMIRRPPNLLVTTPESLYLYLTAERSRATLQTVETVIVDEIHAVARDKRGAHLALSLERLASVSRRAPVRIGLSATVRPVETAARLLVGAGEQLPAVIDSGHRRRLELSLELPDGELEAAIPSEQFGEIVDRIAAHVAAHRTTLVFVNTRKLSERLAHELGERPLDILAQQIVAEAAARGEEGVAEEELLALFSRAWPYRELEREDFEEVVELVSAGIQTGRGRRMAYLHRDRVNGRLRARRGARLAALTSGGAIPETGDYRVLMEPGDVFIGTVNEDFAIESMQGDVFLLGSHPWQIAQVSNGVMRVRDASGRHPTIPFWLGEAPGRTDELSEEVSQLRSAVAERLDAGGRAAAVALVGEVPGVDAVAAALVV